MSFIVCSLISLPSKLVEDRPCKPSSAKGAAPAATLNRRRKGVWIFSREHQTYICSTAPLSLKPCNLFVPR